jgi:hypothetical protein
MACGESSMIETQNTFGEIGYARRTERYTAQNIVIVTQSTYHWLATTRHMADRIAWDGCRSDCGGDIGVGSYV